MSRIFIRDCKLEVSGGGALTIKPDIRELKNALSIKVPNITSHDIDEMAIPSYLHSNPLVRWLMWRRYEVVADLCGFQDKSRVLEFGCGSGIFLPTLAKNCSEVYAIDLFPQFAQNLVRQRGLEISFVDSLDQLSDSSLDIVIAADVLEHFEDPTETLDQIRAILKPTGRLIVSGPTENFAYKLGRILSGFGDKGDYHHTNIEDLARRINGAGFVNKKTVTLPFVFPPYLFKVIEFFKCA